MNTYTVDQERKRAGVETRLRARFPDLEICVYNLPGYFRLATYMPELVLIDREIKYNVFALVKFFAAELDYEKGIRGPHWG